MDTFRILVIEDSMDDFLLLERELRKGGFEPEMERVENAEAMISALSRQPWDFIIADYIIPGFSGLQALEIFKSFRMDIPFIILSGKVGEEIAVDTMKAGAHDYILKDKMFRLVPAIKRELAEAEERRQRRFAELKLKESYDKLKRVVQSTILSMSLMVEYRDPSTAGHQQRVAELAYTIGSEMNLNHERLEGLRFAALIHDIGKISIPADILNKPGRLSDEEFELIKTHPLSSYEILKTIEFPWPVAQITLQHHERYNGTGYPHGLEKEEILIESKIVAVADVVEAMASHRPYHPARPINVALDEITKNRGILYDPEVVEACLGIFDDQKYQFQQAVPMFKLK